MEVEQEKDESMHLENKHIEHKLSVGIVMYKRLHVYYSEDRQLRIIAFIDDSLSDSAITQCMNEKNETQYIECDMEKSQSMIGS